MPAPPPESEPAMVSAVGIGAVTTPVSVVASAGLGAVRQDDHVSTLILLRHGESEWNSKNLFTGWVDVDLTEAGEAEGVRAGQLLLEHDLLPDVVHTSLLRRAIRTAQISLNTAGRHWIPTRRSWRLNERHYGALQGKDKAAVRAEFGDEQFMLWRRSYDVPPPKLADDDQYSQVGDPRYADLLESVPRTECLADVIVRLLPYWYDSIVGDLRAGNTVLVAAHGNSLRALIKHLDGLSGDEVVNLNVPTGIPLRYELDPVTFLPTKAADYLDPAAASAAIEAVANQGKK
jgi:2,3-bisphosphoglycerate-dependent phosphoglycerate mutase